MDYDQAMEGHSVSFKTAAFFLTDHAIRCAMGPSGELLVLEESRDRNGRFCMDWKALPLRSDAIMGWLGY